MAVALLDLIMKQPRSSLPSIVLAAGLTASAGACVDIADSSQGAPDEDKAQLWRELRVGLHHSEDRMSYQLRVLSQDDVEAGRADLFSERCPSAAPGEVGAYCPVAITSDAMLSSLRELTTMRIERLAAAPDVYMAEGADVYLTALTSDVPLIVDNADALTLAGEEVYLGYMPDRFAAFGEMMIEEMLERGDIGRPGQDYGPVKFALRDAHRHYAPNSIGLTAVDKAGAAGFVFSGATLVHSVTTYHFSDVDNFRQDLGVTANDHVDAATLADSVMRLPGGHDDPPGLYRAIIIDGDFIILDGFRKISVPE